MRSGGEAPVRCERREAGHYRFGGALARIPASNRARLAVAADALGPGCAGPRAATAGLGDIQRACGSEGKAARVVEAGGDDFPRLGVKESAAAGEECGEQQRSARQK